MENVWVLVSSCGYEGYGAPGDVGWNERERYCFSSKADALAYLAAMTDIYDRNDVEVFELTPYPAHSLSAGPAVNIAE